MSTSFAGTIKPYFTAYFRAHMLNFSANFDLWDPKVVEAAWPAIYNQISGGSMPTPLTPPATYAGYGTILHKHNSWSIFRPGKLTGMLREYPVSGMSRSMRSPIGLAYDFEQIVW